MQTAVTEYLERLGIRFQVKPHGSPVFTSEDAARERGVRLSQIVKAMVARDGRGGLHVALIPGDRTLKMNKLRRVAGDRSIELIPPAQLEERLGLTVGAISPFQFVELGARFYMDGSVLDEDLVDISSGHPEAGVELSSRELRDLLQVTMCEIASAARG